MVIQVRCCCDAHLIGYMHGETFERGQTYTFLVLPKRWIGDGEPIQVVRGEWLEFACLEFRDYKTGEEGLALQSRDYPLEQLQRIRGFVPVKV
jgi:hypothetical protein